MGERTGVIPGTPAPLFKMNPKVDDIPDKYCTSYNDIKLIIMGTLKKGGGGCACPEYAFLKTLLSYLMVARDEWVLIEKIKLALRDQTFQSRIDPPEIAVYVPSRLKDALPKELLVELGEIPEKITSEEKVSGTVSRELHGLPVRPALLEVTVILEPREQRRDKLGPLKLKALLPADVIGKYDLKFETEADNVVDVTVVGPAAELDKLKSASQEKVRAYIDLDPNKHAKATDTYTYYPVTVRFIFDDDVYGVEIFGPPKIVKVRLEKKPTE